jgi:hypothetical protein
MDKTCLNYDKSRPTKSSLEGKDLVNGDGDIKIINEWIP